MYNEHPQESLRRQRSGDPKVVSSPLITLGSCRRRLRGSSCSATAPADPKTPRKLVKTGQKPGFLARNRSSSSKILDFFPPTPRHQAPRLIIPGPLRLHLPRAAPPGEEAHDRQATAQDGQAAQDDGRDAFALKDVLQSKNLSSSINTKSKHNTSIS